jgi:hypothetical protein
MMLKTFLRRIFEVAKRGDAREESYYSSLEELLSNYEASIKRKQTYITTIPKKTEAGNPDFRVWDGKQHIVGYIEAKAPTVEYLDQIETTDQLIGGYQVCDKWLKDRKGKSLTLDDVRHYCKVVTTLKETIGIQKEIDKLYPKVEERLIEFEH